MICRNLAWFIKESFSVRCTTIRKIQFQGDQNINIYTCESTINITIRVIETTRRRWKKVKVKERIQGQRFPSQWKSRRQEMVKWEEKGSMERSKKKRRDGEAKGEVREEFLQQMFRFARLVIQYPLIVTQGTSRIWSIRRVPQAQMVLSAMAHCSPYFLSRP